MDLRHSVPLNDPAVPTGALPVGAAPTAVRFRVDGRLTAVKAAGSGVFLLLALYFAWSDPDPDPARVGFALLAALLSGGYAIRDLVIPVRLSADAGGITVARGFAGRRRLTWDQIERIRLDRRSRLGTRSELLEIDAGETLHLFSGYDLGMPCWAAAQALGGLAPGRLTGELPGELRGLPDGEQAE